MGYHIREGRHKLLPFDRNHYMDFADKYMKERGGRRGSRTGVRDFKSENEKEMK